MIAVIYYRQGTAARLRDFCSDVRWDASSNTVGNWLFRSLDVLICRPISYVMRRPTLWALGRVFRDRKGDDSMMSLSNSSAEIIVVGDLVQVRWLPTGICIQVEQVLWSHVCLCVRSSLCECEDGCRPNLVGTVMGEVGPVAYYRPWKNDGPSELTATVVTSTLWLRQPKWDEESNNEAVS